MLLKGSFCISETKQTFWALFQMIQLTSKLCDWKKLQEIRFKDNDLAMAQNGTKKIGCQRNHNDRSIFWGGVPIILES